MKQILITGATGNIGMEVVRYLCDSDPDYKVIIAARNVNDAREKFLDLPNLQYRSFDFRKQVSFDAAFKDIDLLFLLRPPQISKVDIYFKPLLQAAKDQGIQKIIFLSVQSAERSKVIPHNKIERLIKEMHFKYIFVRPSYFMQNLTTTLHHELQSSQTITLPSGDARFNWVDVKNIAESIAVLIHNFDMHQDTAIEITGSGNMNFEKVTELLSKVLNKSFQFKSINPISFYFKKKREGMDHGFALIMTVLHFLPRFQKESKISDNYFKLTGKQPTSLKEFIKREAEYFT